MHAQFTPTQQEEIVSYFVELYQQSAALHRELEQVKAEFDAVPSYVERFVQSKGEQQSR